MEDRKTCFQNNRTTLRTQWRFRSEAHNEFNAKLNKIALSANVNKKLQTYDGVISYRCSAGPTKMCKEELIKHLKIKAST